MEFKFDIKDLSEQPILKIDYSLIPNGYEYDVKYGLYLTNYFLKIKYIVEQNH